MRAVRIATPPAVAVSDPLERRVSPVPLNCSNDPTVLPPVPPTKFTFRAFTSTLPPAVIPARTSRSPAVPVSNVTLGAVAAVSRPRTSTDPPKRVWNVVSSGPTDIVLLYVWFWVVRTSPPLMAASPTLVVRLRIGYCPPTAPPNTAGPVVTTSALYAGLPRSLSRVEANVIAPPPVDSNRESVVRYIGPA